VALNNQPRSRPPGLKALFRKIAKRVHPDLARSDADRSKREHLMKEANAAYEKGNLDRLTSILEELETVPDTMCEAVPTSAAGWFEYGMRLWTQRKYREAVRYFERGLQHDPDHPLLHFHLGVAYYQGLGVPTNYAQAVASWQKAAEKGNAEAQNNLGQAYELGNGAEQDYGQAASWYRKAGAQGHITSQFNIGVMYELGNGVPQDFAQAATWYQKAADRGYAPAQFNLGLLYELGQGVLQDFEQAAVWYHEAAECGMEEARQALWEVLRKMPDRDREAG
jgi:TPR repeat protein